MTSRNMGTQGRYATPDGDQRLQGACAFAMGEEAKLPGQRSAPGRCSKCFKPCTKHSIVSSCLKGSRQGLPRREGSAHSHRLKALARSSKRRLRARNDAYAGHGLVGSEIKHESARKRKHTRHKGEHK